MTSAGQDTPGPSALRRRRFRPTERIWLLLLLAATTISVLVTVALVFTLAGEALPFFGETSLLDFLTGTTWEPIGGEFGLLPLLTASLLISLIACLVAVPVGLGAAIYLAEYADERFRRVVKPILEILAGMPTVVLGFFAIEAVTPFLYDVGILELPGFNMLAAGLVVGLLITPLISSLSEDALRAVPRSMREGAFGLGATRSVVSLKVVLPAALSGVMASIVLALSRAIGETMAVTLAAGSQPNLTLNPTEPGQTITAVVVQISGGEAIRGSVQYESIFALGLTLFVITLVINIVAVRLVRRFRVVYQ